MAKAWAKIVIRKARNRNRFVWLDSDLECHVLLWCSDGRAAFARARAWARRLGDIPVEVED